MKKSWKLVSSDKVTSQKVILPGLRRHKAQNLFNLIADCRSFSDVSGKKGAPNLVMMRGKFLFFAMSLRPCRVCLKSLPTHFQKSVINDGKLQDIVFSLSFFPLVLSGDRADSLNYRMTFHVSQRFLWQFLQTLVVPFFFSVMQNWSGIISQPNGSAYHVIIQERFHCQSVYAVDDYPMLPYHPSRRALFDR